MANIYRHISANKKRDTKMRLHENLVDTIISAIIGSAVSIALIFLSVRSFIGRSYGEVIFFGLFALIFSALTFTITFSKE